MKTLMQDPLLGIAKVILLIGMGLFAFAGIVTVITIPVLGIMHDRVGEALVEAGGDAGLVWAVIAILAVATAVLALAFYFTRHMKRIVDSVGEGDPFVPDNANRLTSMAWLMLGIQIAVIPLAGLATFLASALEDQGGEVDMSIEPNSLILVLTLFILARVFRKGTQMRDDLEGTV